MSNNVSYTFENGIASIAMDDGKANALSHQMWDELEEAFNQAETDNAIVIFKGRPGLFSGGFDLKEISKGPEKALLLTSRGSKMARRILSFPFPVPLSFALSASFFVFLFSLSSYTHLSVSFPLSFDLH